MATREVVEESARLVAQSTCKFHCEDSPCQFRERARARARARTRVCAHEVNTEALARLVKQ
jgi:hypothetical protein